MSLEKYHDAMADCTEKTTPYVNQALQEVKNASSSGAEQLIEEMGQKRDNDSRLRDFLVESAYKAVSGRESVPEEVYQIGGAIEVYNQSTYMLNWYFDDKCSLSDDLDEKQAVISGMRLYDKAREMIERSDAKDSTKNQILEELTMINDELYQGQEADVSRLNIREEPEELDEDAYEEVYREMCREKCGYFMGFVARSGGYIGLDYDRRPDTAVTEKYREIESLSDFGESLGEGIQIVNDVADFVLSKNSATYERPYQDLFSDMENGLITMPAYELLEDEDASIDKEKIGEPLTAEDKQGLLETMVESQSFDRSMRLSRQLRKDCKEALEEAFSKEQRSYMSMMTMMLDSSTVYRTLRDDYEYELEI